MVAVFHSHPLVPALLLLLQLLPLHPAQTTSNTMFCSTSQHTFTIAISRNASNPTPAYVLELVVPDTNRLPVVMAVWEGPGAGLDVGELARAGNLDWEGVVAGRKQAMRYVPGSAQTSFVIEVRRIGLAHLPYYTNLNQQVQLYNGTNPSQLQNCTLPITYTLSLTVTPAPNLQPITLPPLSSNDCPHGIYNSMRCKCGPTRVGTLCETQIKQILLLGSALFESAEAGQTQYYYYRSDENLQGSVTVELVVEGKNTGKYIYNSTYGRQQFVVMWRVLESGADVQVPTVFSQADPSSITGIILRAGQVLAVAVYRPTWSTDGSYTFTINEKKFVMDQFLVIIIAASAAIACLAVIALVCYIVISKGRRNAELLASLGLSDGAALGIGNKVSNDPFDIDAEFPAVAYGLLMSQLHAQTTQTDPNPDNPCSICLQPYNQPALVRMTYCRHLFHTRCLLQWVSRQLSCPLCRQEFHEQALKATKLEMGLMGLDAQPMKKYKAVWEWVRKQGAAGVEVPVEVLGDENTSHHINVYAQEGDM